MAPFPPRARMSRPTLARSRRRLPRPPPSLRIPPPPSMGDSCLRHSSGCSAAAAATSRHAAGTVLRRAGCARRSAHPAGRRLAGAEDVGRATVRASVSAPRRREGTVPGRPGVSSSTTAAGLAGTGAANGWRRQTDLDPLPGLPLGWPGWAVQASSFPPTRHAERDPGPPGQENGNGSVRKVHAPEPGEWHRIRRPECSLAR
jgi:hypothetical protein